MRPDAADLLLLAAGLTLALTVPRAEPLQRMAAQRLGDVERLELAGEVAYRGPKGALLAFTRRGVEGPLRGAVVLRGARIEEVVLLESREGLNHRALQRPGFLAAFRGLPARAPVPVDAVSGATISSHLLVEAVEERLARWGQREP